MLADPSRSVRRRPRSRGGSALVCGLSLLAVSRASGAEPAAAARAGDPPPVSAVVPPPLSPSLAPASPALREAMAADYCQHVTNVAASESALLWSPRLFSRVGLVRGSSTDQDLGNVEQGNKLNLQAGVDVNPIRMHMGSLVEARARAECGRYGAELAFRDLEAELVLDERPALNARAEALRARVPQAEELLGESARALAASRISLQQHALTRTRVDTLRQSLAEAEFELASVAPVSSSRLPAEFARRVFDQVRFWEARRQEIDNQLRRAGAIGVSLRAGYDEVFGVDQRLPVFASVNLDFVPGRLWQGARDRESAEAHRRWVEHRIRQVQDLLRGATERLQLQIDISERQLAQLDLRIKELSARHAELGRLETPAALDFRQQVWFELTRLEADRAFLKARVEALSRQRHELDEALRG